MPPSKSKRKKYTAAQKRAILKRRRERAFRRKYGHVQCKRGQIIRNGYVRKSKSGKITVVPSVCIEDRGKKGKGKKLPIKLKAGRLRKYGYSSKKSTKERHAALERAIRIGKEDPLSVYRRLIVISTMNKNTNPKISKKIKADANYVKRAHYTKGRGIKKSSRTKGNWTSRSLINPSKRKSSKRKISKRKPSKRSSSKRKTSKKISSKRSSSKRSSSKRISSKRKTSHKRLRSRNFPQKSIFSYRYSITEPNAIKRRQALNKAIKDRMKPSSVFMELVRNGNDPRRIPKLNQRMLDDAKYIKKKYKLGRIYDLSDKRNRRLIASRKTPRSRSKQHRK